MLHTPIDIMVDLFSARGGEPLATVSWRLEAAGNVDFDLGALLPKDTRDEDRSGGARVTYSYPIGVLQAEVSILDEKRNHAYTIVGRAAYPSVWQTAYLGFRAPTAETYLETAFFNPQPKPVSIGLELLGGVGWQPVERITLQPLEMRKVRVPAATLALSRTASDRNALMRATASVSVTEIVANAWLEDESTGFSNTVLFQELRPASNRLYGSQLVAYGFPNNLLPDSPQFDGYLALANIGQEPMTVNATLHCEIDGADSVRELAALALEPDALASLSLNKILAEQFGHASPAICSAEIVFTGTPGTLLGRYFGESSTLTYGLYSKFESGVGNGFNELYWRVEGDKTPLLTVTNFGSTAERIDIWATRDQGSKILRTVELPAKGSVHINMRQEFARHGAKFEALKSHNFGGFHIRAANPRAKILVKEHIFSLSKHVASPYYGSPDVLDSHYIIDYPQSMVVGQNASAQTVTCYYSGCYLNEWLISSENSSIVSVQWIYNYAPKPITAHQPGNATLTSTASGPDGAGGTLYLEALGHINVYDATPNIGAIVPNTIPAGGSQIAEIYGTNFGSNPVVSATGGIAVTHLYKSSTQINVRFDAAATLPGTYQVKVTSNGYAGTGFQQVPGGGSQSQSNTEDVQVQPPCAAADQSAVYNQYRDLINGTTYRPECSEIETNISTTNFSFNELNVNNTLTYGIFKSSLRTGVECVRTENGDVPLTINSAYRTPVRNRAVGGATESRHIYGDAVDFSAPTGSSLRNNADTVKTACGACREPLSMTPTWVHFDWRSTCPSSW